MEGNAVTGSRFFSAHKKIAILREQERTDLPGRWWDSWKTCTNIRSGTGWGLGFIQHLRNAPGKREDSQKKNFGRFWRPQEPWDTKGSAKTGDGSEDRGYGAMW